MKELAVHMPMKNAKPRNSRLCHEFAVSRACKSTTLILDDPRDSINSIKLA